MTVPSSEEQRQARRLVLVAGDPREVSNALAWTVYPKTFVVKDVDNTFPDGLQKTLDKLTKQGNSARPALVTFSPMAFPRLADPRADAQRIYLKGPCRPDDAGPAGLIFTADRIVVDALDHDAETGAVILSVETCGRQVLRLSGSDNILRGLVFEGSQKSCPKPDCQKSCPEPDCQPSCAQVDTIAVTGPLARRNRI